MAGRLFTRANARRFVVGGHLLSSPARELGPREPHAVRAYDDAVGTAARAFAALALVARVTACAPPEPRHVRVPMQAGVEGADGTGRPSDGALASQPGGPHAVSILGRWEGTGTQDDGTSWLMVVDITNLKAGTCATALYPTVPCAGTWSCLAESDGRTMMAVEHITEGRRECIDGGTMRLVLAADGALDWSWAGAGDAARALLHRSSSGP